MSLYVLSRLTKQSRKTDRSSLIQFVRVLLASLQLSSHDDSLDLHEGDWLDLEPVVHALLYPGEADQYLKDPRLNVASSKSWEVGQEFASYFKVSAPSSLASRLFRVLIFEFTVLTGVLTFRLQPPPRTARRPLRCQDATQV